MLLQVGYSEVVKGSRTNHRGSHIHQLRYAAQRLGYRLTVLRRVPELDDFTGILWLLTRRDVSRHAVLCFQGVVCDPATGVVWDRETYLKRGKWKVEKAIQRLP